MNEQTFKKLQFSTIRELLSGYCSGSLGRELANRIEPSTSAKTVRRWLDQVRELQRVAEDIDLPPLGSVRNIRTFVEQSAAPAGVEAEALNDVASTLEATGVLCRWTESLPEDAPLLRALGGRIGDFTPIAHKIRESIDERGVVRDSASHKLASIRATIASAKTQIDIVFNRLLRQSSITRLLQYTNATFHSDRKVLPLKAEHRGRVNGIVHRSSDSGSTVFVEPTEAVELNNTIVRLRIDEHKEITRILLDLSRLVHTNAGELLKTLSAIGVLDVLVAKVRYARDYGALLPEISSDGSLELREARHPVLETIFRREAAGGADVRTVVPIDVRLGDDFDVLVITGPNTGGKTVAIKTVGLLVLMAQAGIPIPVGPASKLPVFRNVFVDIGDEQSIEQSLSTFSSHLSNLLEILKRAGQASLVLIDELGSGTDPDEGAAIGRAIMEELLRVGASAIITTHLSVLKAVAYTEARIDNGCVEFDVRTLEPLFSLRIGEPGNSNALIIAERLGMSRAMIQNAQAHLDGKHQALTKAISGTLESRRRAEKARNDATEAKLQADEKSREYDRKATALNEARAAHDRWVKWINSLTAGDEVFVRAFDRVGRITRMQFQKQTAMVSSGTVDLEVRLQELLPPDAQP